MTRPFTPHERAVLMAVIESDEQAGVLRAQLEMAEFGKSWFEGSQSFSIVPDPSAPSYRTTAETGDPRIVGGVAVWARGERSTSLDEAIGEMFLWLCDGYVVDLEYPWYTEEMPDRLPDLDQLVDPRWSPTS